MNSKVILLSVAVVAVGLFALPQTMSLFAGQHTWYNGSSVDCRKCHQDIYEEFVNNDSSYHNSWGIDCVRCHATYTGYNGTSVYANITYGQWQKSGKAVNVTAHAAVTVECLACHGTSARTYNASKDKWDNRPAITLQSDAEAHRDFYYGSVSDKEVGDINYTSLKNASIIPASGVPQWYSTTGNQTTIKLKGTNAACIGCHTHAIVNVTWKRSYGYNLTVKAETSGTYNGQLNITGWGVNASKNTTYSSGE